MTRSFIPQDTDLGNLHQLQPLYQSLLQRPIVSAAQLHQWLADFSELAAAVDEHSSRLYINKSCHTDDPRIERAYMDFVEHVEPHLKPLYFQLQRKFLQNPHTPQLTGERFDMLRRNWSADVELFRDQNIPLQTRITQLVSEYDKLSGAMSVEHEGKQYTLQQMERFTEEPDRTTRQSAWQAIADRRLADRDAIDSLFDQLLPLRQQIAHNAGLPDYRQYIWKQYKRFDYTPDDCLKFADSIEKLFVPLAHQLDAQRKAALQLSSLRPWDLAVDPFNRPPLRPFSQDQMDLFTARTYGIFKRLSRTLADQFVSWVEQGNLDLASRTGKQPGGYQCSLEESRQPFIFMNAAGLQRDVETLLHESGHGFHCIASASEPLVFLRTAPMEFCEVASMSMELFGGDHFDLFYSHPDALRAKRSLLEGIVQFFPWMATIDTFQHWIYTHPNHSRAQRTDQWLQICHRFGRSVDWTGLEPYRASLWHKQLHLFHAPFYYVEYGIAQLGALQLWVKALHDSHQALADYRAALALGGTRPLPRLFEAAGIRFDFSPRTIEPLVAAIQDELTALPD